MGGRPWEGARRRLVRTPGSTRQGSLRSPNSRGCSCAPGQAGCPVRPGPRPLKQYRRAEGLERGSWLQVREGGAERSQSRVRIGRMRWSPRAQAGSATQSSLEGRAACSPAPSQSCPLTSRLGHPVGLGDDLEANVATILRGSCVQHGHRSNAQPPPSSSP